MNNYKELAVRYLKMNRKRSMVTVLGVTVAVTVLYAFLNLGWCALLNEREKIREETDYELIFYTETKEQIDAVMADGNVASGYTGRYYDYREEKTYNNALFVNTVNPYRMNAVFDDICVKYGLKGDVNDSLELTYLQGGEANLIYITFLLVLLVSFIFAIFGIGIVRNSIQLSTLEQIKDYGNLRCIGSSRSQLKKIIYLEGTILELTGNAIGLFLGFLASLIAGHFLHMKVGFHWIPIVPVLICFLGDLYFAMQENCKVIVNMTPVSAIRGEYRIRKEKFRARKKSLFGRLFGIEGDYAYKSIMRNPLRFHKTVWAMGISVAAFITVMGTIGSINGQIRTYKERYGYYNVYYGGAMTPQETIDEVQSALPPSDILQKISDMKETLAAKRMYSAEIILADWEEHYGHYSDDYLEKTIDGKFTQRMHEYLTTKEDISEFVYYASKGFLTQITCFGFDEEDYRRFQQVLEEGTLDVSEHGIVIVNAGEMALEEGSESMMDFLYEKIKITDYKVGDTIDIVNTEKLRTMVQEEMKIYQKKLDNKEIVMTEEEKWEYESEEKWEEVMIYRERRAAVQRCREQLLENGEYQTFTIEGIVSSNVNLYESGMTVILPMENYYAITGTDKSMSTGMMYHFDKFPSSKFFRIMSADDSEYWYYAGTDYPEMMAMLDTYKNVFRGIMFFVVFIVMMSTFNIINTTEGSLYLRKNEFAQLRVIGMSKEGLMKMVMLEGVVTSIVANVIGIVLGVAVNMCFHESFLRITFGTEYRFPFLPAVVGLFISTLILCGSIYGPLRRLRTDMAADLAVGGE